MPAFPDPQILAGDEEVGPVPRDAVPDVDHGERHEREVLVELAEPLAAKDEVHWGGDVAGGVRAQAGDLFKQIAAVVVPRCAGVNGDLPGELRVAGVERHAIAQRHGQRNALGGTRVDLLVAGRDPRVVVYGVTCRGSRRGRRHEGRRPGSRKPGGYQRSAAHSSWSGRLTEHHTFPSSKARPAAG